MRHIRNLLAASLILPVLALEAATPANAAGAPLYTVTQSIPLGAPDRWDYLTYDRLSHRVYIAHETDITVVDGRSGNVIGRVEVPGANGVAIVPSIGKGYAGSRTQKSALIFDLSTLKVLKRLPADDDTDAVIYDPFSKRVFIMDGDPHNITVIDTGTDTVIAHVPLEGKPEFASADGAGKLFVNITDKKEIQRVDTKTLRIDATWPITQCEGPHGLSIDPAAHRLFASCTNSRLMVVDATNGRTLASLPIGKGSDATAFDGKRMRAFSSNRGGTLSVVQEDGPNHFESLGETPTQPLARTMTVDPVSGRIYLVAADRIERDPKATDPRKRYGIRPGSVRLLFADPPP